MIVDPSEQSKQDVREIALYLLKENPPIAFRFLEAIEQTYAMLSEFPDLGHAAFFDFVDGLETLTVKDFKHYQIFYRILAGVIRIDRVADGRRNLPKLFAYLAEEGGDV